MERGQYALRMTATHYALLIMHVVAELEKNVPLKEIHVQLMQKSFTVNLNANST